MRPRPLLLVALAATLALLLAGCGTQPRGLLDFSKRAVAPTPNTAPPSHPVVTAFLPSWADHADLDHSRAATSMVAISGIDIAAGGTAVTAPGADVLGQLAYAHKLGKKAEVLLLNFKAGTGFSDEVAKSMLSTKANRDAAAASLAGVVARYGFDGVMFDLEELTADDADDLTAFATELRRDVGPGIHLDAALQASTSAAGYAHRGYDVAGLLNSLDTVTVMAYDQHGTFNPTNPGPIGELTWQRKVLAALLLTATPGQVDLGVAGYGYRWASDRTHTVGDIRARRLVTAAHVTPTFDADRGEWTATLPDGQVFWWADGRSIALREQLAASLGLHGIAVWSLALSDPVPVAP
ncbi:MAG TPA: glycosyl hydrolase family 18 protein [Pseudolysinimonas sp.]|jgi:spore germination protein YaaH